MTDQYFFILGRNSDLSLAEIFTRLQQQQIDYQIIAVNREVLILQAAGVDDDFFSRLGGSKKYGRIFFISPKIDFSLVKKILTTCPKESKFNFGFSFYNFPRSEWRSIQNEFYRQGLSYKKELKAQGVASRLVQTKESDLSSVVVHKEKMITQGGDVVVVWGEGKNYYGRTESVQDYDDFSARDYGKPERDVLSGLLPLKLARIMINLAAVKSGELILDPFCGSGTVLLEALTLGYQARGFDREKNAIDNTNNNLIWYQRNYPLLQAPLVELGRVEKLASRLEENSVAAIVTEPYLGPALKRSLGREALVAIRSELENLYSLALEQFAKVLKPGGRVVMVWPIFVDSADQPNYLQASLPPCLRRVNIVADQVPQFDWLTKKRSSYFYSRPGQRVWREILVLEKK